MVPKWRRYETIGPLAMAVTLSIKNVPDDVAAALRQRAARHRRSLQGELLSILDDLVHGERALTVDDLMARNQARGLTTPDQSVAMLRADRDAR